MSRVVLISVAAELKQRWADQPPGLPLPEEPPFVVPVRSFVLRDVLLFRPVSASSDIAHSRLNLRRPHYPNPYVFLPTHLASRPTCGALVLVCGSFGPQLSPGGTSAHHPLVANATLSPLLHSLILIGCPQFLRLEKEKRDPLHLLVPSCVTVLSRCCTIR